MIIYLAVEFERYWAEAVRTFTFKESTLSETRPEHVKTLYENILEGIKIGKRTSQLHRETMAKIAKAKLKDISDYGLGQGLGLSLRELPLIAQGDRNILAEGMCLSLCLGVRDKELEAIMIAHTIYLSKRGAEVLTA